MDSRRNSQSFYFACFFLLAFFLLAVLGSLVATLFLR